MPNDTMFFKKELTNIQAKVLRKKYPALKYNECFPVDTSDPSGSQYVGYHIYDSKGFSKIMADGAIDSPNVTTTGKEELMRVHDVGNHYSYTKREVREANFAGKSLQSERATASRDATEQFIDKLAFLANTEDAEYHGATSPIYNPNTTKVEVTAGATSGNTSWTGGTKKNPDEIIADFNLVINKITKDTNGTQMCNTIVLPPEIYGELNTTPRSSQTDTSILQYVQQANPEIDFRTSSKLTEMDRNPATLSSGANVNVMLAYYRDPDAIKMRMPMAYTAYPVEDKGRYFKVETSAEVAGVQVVYPLSVIVFYGF